MIVVLTQSRSLKFLVSVSVFTTTLENGPLKANLPHLPSVQYWT